MGVDFLKLNAFCEIKPGAQTRVAALELEIAFLEREPEPGDDALEGIQTWLPRGGLDENLVSSETAYFNPSRC